MPRPENIRVTFWGTRGSCPTFPAAWEVEEYARRVAEATLSAVLKTFVDNLESGKSIDEILVLLERDPEEAQRELAIPKLPVFGGETSCVEVETRDGNTLILDGGSGLRHCAAKILREREDGESREIYLFGSHEHLDHRLGIPYSRLCFADPPFHLRVYGNAAFLTALDERLGVLSQAVSESTYRDDPLDYKVFTASFEAVEIRSGARKASKPERPWTEQDIAEPIRIGSTVVRAFETYHGSTACLGYKIEHGGRSFVFCTDHEVLRPEGGGLSEVEEEAVRESRRVDANIIGMCRGADLAYFDGQYYREEYYGRAPVGLSPPVSRVGWGHGCVEDILEKVSEAGIKHALIGHHDPERDWPAQIAIDERLRNYCAGKSFRVELARDGQTVEL